MKVRLIENKTAWDDFVKKHHSVFVQSYKYGEFYKSLGEESFLVGIYQKDELVGGALVVSTHAKRGDFLYIPYGPIISDNVDFEGAFSLFTKFIKNFANEKKYNFVRISPFIKSSKEKIEILKKLKYKKSPLHVLAENTWILKLDKPEEKIISEMKKNHRNLIRRCERDGVVVTQYNTDEKLSIFHNFLQKTAKRHKFVPFGKKYIKTEFNAFAEDGEAVYFEAKLPDGNIDAAAIIMFYGNMACYRHSASLNLNKKLPSSYLLQWRVIQEAKKRGIKSYNFWGVAPNSQAKNHPFFGITHFKKGFGGEQIDLIPSYDLVINKKYYLNWLVEKIRKIKRGF